MDLKSVLSEVQAWPPEDRLRLIEEVWDSLADDESGPELTPELRDLLDRRLAALEAEPDGGVTWDEIRQRYRTARKPRSVG
ncbi:addiction module protein [Paludisphaera rhizosphaerae]|uniref:addiction module protein n=1 Tax=Paludisphaera rhizosphaerae TaxID=2711216 RepID=UPI0013ED2E50|nr:addiction module protein [Paludisphaera rhizosphaerae]